VSFAGDFAQADNGGSLFRDHARNILVVKVSWWFGR
jgi:hypothetical protein